MRNWGTETLESTYKPAEAELRNAIHHVANAIYWTVSMPQPTVLFVAIGDEHIAQISVNAYGACTADAENCV